MFNALQHIGDLAQFGVHSGANHHRRAAPISHLGSHVGHIQAVAKWQLIFIQGFSMFFNWFRFAGQCGFLNPQIVAFQHAHIGWHDVARFQRNHIARHQIMGGRLSQNPVTVHPHRRNRQLFQRRNCPFGAIFLKKAQQGKQHHNRQDRARFKELAQKQR